MENQDNKQTGGKNTGRTFTQEEVNAIVSKRLNEQKMALNAELDQREKDLEKRQMAVRATELLSEKGLRKELASVLRYDTEEELIAAIDAISNVQNMRAADNSGSVQVIENKLPAFNNDSSDTDSVRTAFGLKG